MIYEVEGVEHFRQVDNFVDQVLFRQLIHYCSQFGLSDLLVQHLLPLISDVDALQREWIEGKLISKAQPRCRRLGERLRAKPKHESKKEKTEIDTNSSNHPSI